MKFKEFAFEESEAIYDALAEVKVAWGRNRSKTRPKLKFRCTVGGRKSRLVTDPKQCFAHPDIARSQRMKKTRARTYAKQARMAKRTRKLNIASKLLNRLNKLLK